MHKITAFFLMLIGCICLGVGGSLLASGILWIEACFCILMSICWFIFAELFMLSHHHEQPIAES